MIITKHSLTKKIEELKNLPSVCVDIPKGDALLSSGYKCGSCPYTNECQNGNMAWKRALDEVLKSLDR